NELPQLWNILKGDMSLVGPRPEDPSIVKQWSEEVFHEVLSVKPGITSAASILYRNEETLLQS
ncbi:MAG: sugar transferase, partial [Aliifodinibius sp.]|nr:sugar transferase [Fodinibius sp.]NIV12402.1 sugar transferase [Fodinibius sp.]NIY24805.1 sugar transferase [Fodinibius sp.]